MGHSATHAELHRLFGRRAFDEIEEHLAPEFMFEDLARHLTLKTGGEFVDYLRGWTAMSSDVTPSEATYYEGADHSVALFHGRGVHDGPMGDLPATGRSIDVPFCEVLHYGADGKVVADELYWDMSTLMGQLVGGERSAEAAGSPAEAMRAFMAAFDRGDFDTVRASMVDDAQGIDEISRAWLRGSDAVNGYFDTIAGAVSDIRSEISDVHEQVFGDTAVVTCWIEQDYTLEGRPQHISSPVTAVMRREENEWKAALMHAVPMPPE